MAAVNKVYLSLRCHKMFFRILLSTTVKCFCACWHSLTWNHSLTTPHSNTKVLFLALLMENQKDVKQGWLRWKRIAPAGHHLPALNDAAYLEKRWKASVLELNVHPESHLIGRLDYSSITEGSPWWCHQPKSQASISRNIKLTWCQIYLEPVLTLPSINTPSWRFIHRILGKLTIALNLSGPVTAACPQTERLLCNIYQGLLPLRRGFITELLIYKNEEQKNKHVFHLQCFLQNAERGDKAAEHLIALKWLCSFCTLHSELKWDINASLKHCVDWAMPFSLLLSHFLGLIRAGTSYGFSSWQRVTSSIHSGSYVNLKTTAGQC